MKTPREILFTRHQAAQPRLDALRDAVVAGLPAAAGPSPARPRALLDGLIELFRLPRPALAGLAAGWLLIVGLNFAARDPEPAAVKAPPPMARNGNESLQQLREQKRLFAELVGTAKDNEAEPPRFTPRPRGEIKTPFHYA